MVSILIVDDSPVDRQLMDGLLSQEPDFDVWFAENVKTAMEQLEQGVIDVVVTDLQLPDGDGLGLVKSIREQHSEIPSILVTAHGSEKIASRALAEGAAGYVNKLELAKKLVESVRNVWVLMQSERTYEKLNQYTVKSELKFELDNDASLIPAVVDLTQQTMKGIADCDSNDRLRIAVCLEQGLLNALYHGNLEVGHSYPIPAGDELPESGLQEIIYSRLNEPLYNNRKIQVLVQIKRQRVSFIIRDDGKGFDHTQKENITEGGRGLVLIRHFMDEIKFNETGNEITMIRFLGLARNRNNDPSFPELQDETKATNYGILVSEHTGREIELTARRILVGRRKSCHIVIPHADVSSQHCQLFIEDGWWCVKDLGSADGIKINGQKIDTGALNPDDVLSVARHNYRIHYTPSQSGAVGPGPPIFD